jgi:hypothetical protein
MSPDKRRRENRSWEPGHELPVDLEIKGIDNIELVILEEMTQNSQSDLYLSPKFKLQYPLNYAFIVR